MYSNHLRLLAIGAALIGAVLSGLLTGWVAATSPDEAAFSVPAAGAGFVGALLAAAVAAGLLLAAARVERGPGTGSSRAAGAGIDGEPLDGRESILGGHVVDPPGQGAPGVDAHADVDLGARVAAGTLPGPAGAGGLGARGLGAGGLGASATSTGGGTDVRAERKALVQACIYVRDRATSKAIADRIGWTLHEVGVATTAAASGPFDPARHEAGGAVPTDDPRLDGTIAAVEAPGYVDHGVVLRPPVVTVYRGRR